MIKRMKAILIIILTIGFTTSSVGWLNAYNQVNETKKIVSEKEREIEEQLTKIANLEDEINNVNSLNAMQKEEIEKSNNEIESLKQELEEVKKNSLGLFEMSSYTAFCPEGCIGITKVGYNVSNTVTYDGMRIVAVDPNVIPLWSIVRIHTKNGSFDAICIDTGGAIKGKKLDFLVASESEAFQNGRQMVYVEMVRRENNMILILEGCDCSGKDTLANALAEKTGYEIVRGSDFQIAEKGTDYMFQYMMDLLDRDNIIINRFYMSNYVYGNLFNKNTMSDMQFMKLANKADKRALTIYTTSSLHTLKNRMKSRGDDDISIDDLEKILNKYSEAISNPMLAQKLLLQVYTEYISDTPQLASTIKSLIDGISI